MILPGETVEETVNGQTYQIVSLSRSQQRNLIALVGQTNGLTESMESIEKLYEIADQIAEIVLPQMSAEERDKVSVTDVLAVGAKTMERQFPTIDAKKN